MRYYFIISGLFSIVLLLILLVIYLLRSPSFPKDIPAAENQTIEDILYTQKIEFYHELQKLLKKYHGGFISSTEEQIQGMQISNTEFIQHYSYLDQNVLLDVIEKISNANEIDYSIELLNVTEDYIYPIFYKIKLFRGEELWIALQFKAQKRKILNYNLDKIQIIPEKKKEKRKKVVPKNILKLAIVIDDLGYDLSFAKKILQTKVNFTYGVLPHLPYSKEIATLAYEDKKDVLLHLPMQPQDWPNINPGPGALLVSDDAKTILEKLNTAFESVPFSIGVNNHMGSAFTSDTYQMQIFMKLLASKKNLFLDSKTSAGKKIQHLAKTYRIDYVARDVFLDNQKDSEYIKKQLQKTIRIVKKYGSAIAICHPFTETLETILKTLPKIKQEKINIVGIHHFVGK